MDAYNEKTLSESKALANFLLDANVLIYAQNAYKALGYPHFLNFLDGIDGYINWYVASCIILKLHNGGSYDFNSLMRHELNCDAINMRMNQFPYIKEDDSLGFVKLNNIAGDDWSQIGLAHNYEKLIIVTNDARMFKSAHASLEGRAIAFYDFLNIVSSYYKNDKDWQKLEKWLITNIKPLRNNSSWIIEDQKVKTHRSKSNQN